MGELGVPAIQLIDEKGSFNEDSLVRFSKEVRLSECGLSYAVVAIMGPQSSGKSTLLNHLFGTRFREMNALEGRNQTTKGVWLQRAEGVAPCSLVMDLEGTDGRERGEDDTAFEKQSALFSLAVADVVLINLWCHDIGREQAANKPMLKTVFQVMTRLFSPRKTTLVFVLRDKTRTPMKILERILRSDVERIWEGIPKEKDTPLMEFFKIEVTALSNYEEKEERFMEEVRQLKERFQNSVAPGGLAGDRRAVVPGSGFPFSAHEIWKVIKENKDLDLPAHKVMVATVRCDEIAHEKLQSLAKDEEWKKLEKDCKVAEFGNKVSEVLKRYTSEYDVEAGFFDERVRTAKRSFLVSEALEMMSSAHDAVVAHHRAAAFERFRHGLQAAVDSEHQEFTATVRHFKIQALRSFDEACADASVPQAAEAWNPSKAREKLYRDMNAQAHSLRTEGIQALRFKWESRLEDGIGEPVAALLEAGPMDAWASIRELVASEIDKASTGLARELKGYEPTREEEGAILKSLPKHSRAVVEGKDREATSQALIRMKDRFHNLFGHDEESLPRVWGEEHNIRAVTKTARVGVLKMVAVIAALRLRADEEDGVEDALLSLVNDSEESSMLSSSTWPGVADEDTMLHPVECRSLWRQFKAETEYTISQALSAQEAKMRKNNRLPPAWAVAAMVILGFNEFMALLQNPVYLSVVIAAFMLVRAVWVQFDLDRHFQYGVMPGLVSVSSKYMPAVVEAFQGVVDAGTTTPPQPSEANNNLRRNEGKLAAYDCTTHDVSKIR